MRAPSLATLAVLAVLVAPAADGSAAPTPTSIVLADGTFRLDMPVHVGPGSTLTIRNATVYFDARGCGLPACEPPTIRVEGGTLLVQRSRLDTSRGDMSWSLVGEGARIEMLDSVVANYSYLSLQLAGDAPSRVERTTFRDAYGPLTFSRGALGDIRDNRFKHVVSGVALRDTSGTLVGNAFHDVRGGRAIDVQATILGEKSFATMPLVQGNLVEEADVGMVSLNGFPNPILENTFRNNRLALLVNALDGRDYQHTDAPIVEGNVFQGNQLSLSMGVSAAKASGGVRTLHAHGNAFLGEGCPHVLARLRPDVTIQVDATDNWWGSPDGPAPARDGCAPVSSAAVTAAPWRAEWSAN